jgi:hypothetical protein
MIGSKFSGIQPLDVQIYERKEKMKEGREKERKK